MSTLSLPSVYNLITLDKVKSTNTEAINLATKGESFSPDGTLIWAREQSEGRGRRGKEWKSPRGNLYTSLILRPEVSVAESAQLGFVAALAIYDALGNIGPAGHQVHCKWPNDVLLNEKKVAGILLESDIKKVTQQAEWIILGLGLNVEWHPSNTEYPATSLRFEGWGSQVEEVLQAFSRSFLSWTNKWLEDGFKPIRKNWLLRSIGIGKTIKVHVGEQKIEGIFDDLAEDGALLLNQNGNISHIRAGDIFFKN